MRNKIVKPLILIGFSSLFLSAQAQTITGAGASFPYPIYAKWAMEYQKNTGEQINYQSIGSGGGVRQIVAGTVDFGATDDPLSIQKLKQHQLIQFPAIIGGTVPVIHLPNIQAGQLKLSGELLADIYLGKIKYWDDKAIQSLNSHLSLPHKNILVIHRADGSGTTFGWTNYLSKVSPTWKNNVGEGKSVKWPVGQGGKGNEGVAAYVKQLKYSIGYVEYAYAKQNHLAWVSLRNKAGKFVQPSGTTFAAAASSTNWNKIPGMAAILTNSQGEKAWPITAASFILVPQQSKNAAKTLGVFNFFNWAFAQGKEAAVALDYVPLPDEVIETIKQNWQAAQDSQGHSIYQNK